jgi:hypothetical protein
MANFHQIMTFSYESGQVVQTRNNEIENADCMVTGLPGAPVRLLLRFGVSLQEARMALRAFSAKLDDVLDDVAESEANTIGYIP